MQNVSRFFCQIPARFLQGSLERTHCEEPGHRVSRSKQGQTNFVQNGAQGRTS